MITTHESNPARPDQAALEHEALLQRSSAPTLRDLRMADTDLFPAGVAEPDAASPYLYCVNSRCYFQNNDK